jgi:hypothetical protein
MEPTLDIKKLMRAQAHGAAMPDPATDYIDGRIGQIGTEELVITQWLIDNNLTVDIPEWFSYEFYSRNKTGEAGEARHAMNPEGNREDLWQLDFDGDQVPLIATYDQVKTDGRRQAISERRSGFDLEQAHVDRAILNVNIATEKMVINGLRDKMNNLAKYMGVGISGLLGSTNTFDYLDLTTQTPLYIFNKISAELQNLRTNMYYESVGIFLPSNYAGLLDADYSVEYPGSLAERLSKLRAGNVAVDIMVAPRLPDHRIVIIPRSSRTVQLILGQEPKALSVPSIFGYYMNHLVVACALPFIQSDSAGNYGVIVGNLE